MVTPEYIDAIRERDETRNRLERLLGRLAELENAFQRCLADLRAAREDAARP
jgi:hypothetical protein